MNSATALRLSLLLLGACASVSHEQQQPKSSAVSTTAPTARARGPEAAGPPSAASTGSLRLLDATPEDLPAQIAEQVALLSDICPVALHYDAELGAGGVVAGCRTCPPFEGPSAAPDGKIAVDSEEFFPLELLVSGHFTRAQADQRLAVFNGCEPHSENWGGSVLVERVAGHFKSLSYASGVRPQKCKTYRRLGGRDLAVCEFADAHQSVATDSLASLDFSATPPTVRELLTLTSQDGCAAKAGATSAVEQSISDFEFGAHTATANILTVHIVRTTQTLNAAYARYCEQRAASETRIAPPSARREALTLRFRYDGRGFVAN